MVAYYVNLRCYVSLGVTLWTPSLSPCRSGGSAWMVVTDWVPMFPLNDLTMTNRRDRVPAAALFAL